MKAIHVLKQNDLFLIENAKTKKVFVANDVEGKERVCEHDHDKKDFIKSYQSSDGKDKPCKKCRSDSKTNAAKINVKLEHLSLDAQNMVNSAAQGFFPCFDTKDLLFYLEIHKNLLEWVDGLNQIVFQGPQEEWEESGDATFKPDTSNMVETFFIQMTNIYNSDFGSNAEMYKVLSIYLYVNEEVRTEIKSLRNDIETDLLTDDEICQLLLGKSIHSFQYTNKNQRMIDYHKLVFRTLYLKMGITVSKAYDGMLPQVKMLYRAKKFETYFRTNSMLRMLALWFSSKGKAFALFFQKQGTFLKMDNELLSRLKKARSCFGIQGFSEVRKLFIDQLKLSSNEEMALFFSLDTPLQIQEFANYKIKNQMPDLAIYRVPVIKIQYNLLNYDDENDENKVTSVRVVKEQCLITIYDVFFHLSLFDDDGILLGKQYKEQKIYSNVTFSIE